MKLSYVCLAMMLSVTTLTACNNAQNPKDEPKTEQTSQPVQEAPKAEAPQGEATQPVATSTPATNVSPTLLMYIETMKASTGMQLMASQTLTPEQTACLYSNDANATYLESAKEQLGKALGEEGLKASDEFYASELGQKLIKFTQQQLQQATGRPIEGEAIVLTSEDEVKIVEFSQSDVGKKIEANTKNIDPQAMMKQMQAHLDSEKARCKIG